MVTKVMIPFFFLFSHTQIHSAPFFSGKSVRFESDLDLK